MQKKQQPKTPPQTFGNHIKRLLHTHDIIHVLQLQVQVCAKLCSLEAKLNPAFLALKGVLQVKQPQISICLSFNCVITISIKG